MPNPQSLLSTVPLPLWALGALLFLLFAVGLWAAMPVLLRRTSIRWPLAGPNANMVVALLAIVGAVLFFISIGAAFTVLWHTAYNAVKLSERGISLGAGSLIAALLGAPFLIWGTILKTQTVRYQKEGHMTDRIAKAVEMLGAEKTVKKDGIEETQPNLEVRIGAILSLERIALDSTTHDNGRDHVSVMEILCAYIRENATIPLVRKTPPPKPRVDIALVVSVLGRRTEGQISLEVAQKHRLDLSDTNLDGLSFRSGNFAGANLTDCSIRFSDFYNVNLSGTRFNRSDISGSAFRDAIISGTNFSECKTKERASRYPGFTEKNFRSAYIQGADFSFCFLPANCLPRVFGSKDTVLRGVRDKDSWLDSIDVHEIAGEDDDFRKRATHTREEIENGPFKYWSPYFAQDLANGHFLDRFRTDFNLEGWTFEG